MCGGEPWLHFSQRQTNDISHTSRARCLEETCHRANSTCKKVHRLTSQGVDTDPPRFPLLANILPRMAAMRSAADTVGGLEAALGRATLANAHGKSHCPYHQHSSE